LKGISVRIEDNRHNQGYAKYWKSWKKEALMSWKKRNPCRAIGNRVKGVLG